MSSQHEIVKRRYSSTNGSRRRYEAGGTKYDYQPASATQKPTLARLLVPKLRRRRTDEGIDDLRMDFPGVTLIEREKRA